MKLVIPSSNTKKNWPFYGELIVILLLIAVVFTVPYIQSQRVFLGGDINDGFYQYTLQVVEIFQQSPIAALQLIYKSFSQDYNKFFSLPLIPFFLLFGNSYLVYVLGLTIVYLLPFALTMGAIAAQLIPVYANEVLASTALITVLLSPNWVTIFQGYPDISATLVISLTLWVALNGVGSRFGWLLTQRWQVPILGILLAAAVLLRRHFAYAGVALLAAMLLHTAIVFGLEVRRYPVRAWRKLGQFGLRLVLALATTIAVVMLLAPKFAQRVVASDYVSLYESWSRSVPETLVFYTTLYGWGVWLLVVLGILAGLWTRVLAIPVALFISTFGCVSLSIWLLKLRYTETYYAIHFVPFIILGIAALIWSIVLKVRGHKKTILVSLISLYLITNAIVGLTPIGQFRHGLRSVFAANHPPVVRTNYDNVLQVVEFLRQIAPNQESIFVVYSGHLPEYLVLAAEKTLYGDDGRILNLRKAALTDSDGFYPIRELLEAEFVVITEPFLAWHEGEQDAIKTAFAAFTEPWEIAQDFRLLPQTFDLQAGAITRIYQRIQPTTVDRAIRTLYTMQTRVNKPLGEQLSWVALDPRSNVKIRRKGKRNYNLQLPPGSTPQADNTTLVYLRDLPDQAELKGRVIVPKTCQNAVLTFAPLNGQGQPTQPARSIVLHQTTPLDLTVNGAGATYLQLEVQRPTQKMSEATKQGDRCSLKINNLNIAS